MILKRFYDEKLAQASYLIGCAATGEALVVDANRDLDPYLRTAEQEGVRITHVTETHIHADYVSGSRELARRAGAQLYLSDEGGPEWRYRFAAEEGAVLLHGGDRFRVGNVIVDVLHTPGHTPEHLTFLITDGAAADRPIGALTGDFLFVGDVGRPDLLERAAGYGGTMEEAARTLFRSLQTFKSQPDYLQIWPGHGAGSACGKGLSAIPHSTVGYERLFNWGLAEESEEAFVTMVLAGQPEPPRYFARMKRINRDGPQLLGGRPHAPHLPDEALAERLAAGALVVDTRRAAEFARGHVPGTLSVPLDRNFTTTAGSLLPYDQDLHLLLDEASESALEEALRALTMIGLDRVAGYFGTGAVDAWSGSGRPLETLPQVSPDELAERLERGEALVVDVRGAAEWEAARIPGVGAGGSGFHVPLGSLPERAQELPRDVPLVLQCQSGRRSAIAASLLAARGFDVSNLAGGLEAWRAAGRKVERGQAESARAPTGATA